MQPLNIESIDLEITTKCNLACPYCYIGMQKLKADANFGDMTDETIEDVFKLIQQYGWPEETEITYPDGKKKKIGPTKISFYGGEPMCSWERVVHFIERSEALGMRLGFSLLSNGTLGTEEQVAYLKKKKIWTQRSIDGCPVAQEKYRPGSIEAYERVTQIFKDFESSRRMTVQPEFAKLLKESMLYFESQGFHAGISPMPNYYTDWSEEQIHDFVASLWELGRYYLARWKEGKPFYLYYFSREMVSRFVSPRACGQFGCGGGSGLHCVSWDGSLYLCHRFSKEPKDGPFCFGSVKDILAGTAKGYGHDVQHRIWQYHQRDKYWNPECKSCYARHGCEKGCMHTNYICTGTLNKMPRLYCILRQEAAQIVTWLDSELRTKNPDWWCYGNKLPAAQQRLRERGKRAQKTACQQPVQPVV